MKRKGEKGIALIFRVLAPAQKTVGLTGNLARYEAEMEDEGEEAEYQVDSVVNHRKSADGELEFEVKWSTGEVTWEAIRYLIDVDENGKRTVNKELKKYAQEKRVRLVMSNEGS